MQDADSLVWAGRRMSTSSTRHASASGLHGLLFAPGMHQIFFPVTWAVQNIGARALAGIGFELFLSSHDRQTYPNALVGFLHDIWAQHCAVPRVYFRLGKEMGNIGGGKRTCSNCSLWS